MLIQLRVFFWLFKCFYLLFICIYSTKKEKLFYIHDFICKFGVWFLCWVFGAIWKLKSWFPLIHKGLDLLIRKGGQIGRKRKDLDVVHIGWRTFLHYNFDYDLLKSDYELSNLDPMDPYRMTASNAWFFVTIRNTNP
jgi:hypothetical protein